ncbi:hypothetical protein K504DRAFT_467712 [Pleomassaria siparia CBS 279.74]|uniref:Uncharacterized protein n=1 Tax=Pleomassaria siparia CBS 279.74 TaxID=1314801 RepID=A0A6G1KAH5_9PLEO|nr:hypothetical protein K504DRAFT_467712 [Pleomassaria siparia CBS 279.74]
MLRSANRGLFFLSFFFLSFILPFISGPLHVRTRQCGLLATTKLINWSCMVLPT